MVVFVDIRTFLRSMAPIHVIKMVVDNRDIDKTGVSVAVGLQCFCLYFVLAV